MINGDLKKAEKEFIGFVLQQTKLNMTRIVVLGLSMGFALFSAITAKNNISVQNNLSKSLLCLQPHRVANG